MSELVSAAIEKTSISKTTFAKFLSPNDTGLTGGHQCGIYIPKNSVKLIFDEPFERGENHQRFANITWNNDRITRSSFTYYGQGTRNEYRITRFGRGFDYLKPDHTGDLVVICKESDENYAAYILSTEEDIESYLEALSLSPTNLNRLISSKQNPAEEAIFETYLMKFGEEFPSTIVMAISSEEIDEALHGPDDFLDVDDKIVRLIDTEYQLFRKVEEHHYFWVTERPADSLDHFIQTGLEITNRRKARAGKSLEHHLSSIFEQLGISFTAQAVTEGKKRPDFIFPSEEAYHDATFPAEKLIFLGAKTTCKDRWRQVLNEADRIDKKYLFTLQQGISPNQLDEMHAENLVLVVPKQFHDAYPRTSYESVISLEEFIRRVKSMQ